MSDKQAYASVPRALDVASISAANTNRNGTGTIVQLCAGSANGFRVSSITAKAIVTTTAGAVRIFVSINSGTTWRLLTEIPVDANTASASNPAWEDRIEFDDLILKGTTVWLGASTEKAEAFEMTVNGGDL